MNILRPCLLLSLAAGVAAGCASVNQIHGDPTLLQFLEDGKTTREQALLKLGQPSAVLEAEKVLTFRLGYEKSDGYTLIERAPVGWAGVKYNLVLVFDAQGVLSRHSLVEVR